MMGSENQQVPSPPSSEMMARQKQPSASVKQKVLVIHKQIGFEGMLSGTHFQQEFILVELASISLWKKKRKKLFHLKPLFWNFCIPLYSKPRCEFDF